jgi:hypothetical protein
MANISSHHTGITVQELKEAIPLTLQSKDIHLHWIDFAPAGNAMYTLSAKLEVDAQILLLTCKTSDTSLIDDWEVDDPSYHTNARLVALERILTDPDNEVILMRL